MTGAGWLLTAENKALIINWVEWQVRTLKPTISLLNRSMIVAKYIHCPRKAIWVKSLAQIWFGRNGKLVKSRFGNTLFLLALIYLNFCLFSDMVWCRTASLPAVFFSCLSSNGQLIFCGHSSDVRAEFLQSLFSASNLLGAFYVGSTTAGGKHPITWLVATYLPYPWLILFLGLRKLNG